MEQLALSVDQGQAAEPPAVPAPARRGRQDERGDEGQGHADDAGQLALLPGGRQRATITSEAWSELVTHGATRARYEAKIWRDEFGCWWWLGALSSSGHGKLRAGPGARTVVTAHVFGWQLHHGLIAARPGEDPVVAHRCDEASCQRPDHWELIERTANGADYLRRRHRAEGPLADVRGAAGRAAAIRAAILDAQARGADAAAIGAAVRDAQAAGLRTTPALF